MSRQRSRGGDGDGDGYGYGTGGSEDEKGGESEVDTDLDVTYTNVDGHVPFSGTPPPGFEHYAKQGSLHSITNTTPTEANDQGRGFRALPTNPKDWTNLDVTKVREGGRE